MGMTNEDEDLYFAEYYRELKSTLQSKLMNHIYEPITNELMDALKKEVQEVIDDMYSPPKWLVNNAKYDAIQDIYTFELKRNQSGDYTIQEDTATKENDNNG